MPGSIILREPYKKMIPASRNQCETGSGRDDNLNETALDPIA